ncbi:MAG: hypothetical protein IRZ16_08615 [Myxococcaceae bacterium]|nr:hypothetical protein [Myxococcaceae bacterium]
MRPTTLVLSLVVFLSLAACSGQPPTDCDHCPEGQACDASGVCQPSGGCASNDDCAARDPSKPFCNDSGTCVACLDSTSCSGATPICGEDGACRGCNSNAECFAANPATSVCSGDGSCRAGTITASLTADKQTYVVGTAPPTVTWTTTNATSCQLRDGMTTLSTETNGSLSYTPTQSVTLTLQCQGDGEITRTLDIRFQPAIFVDDDATSATPDGMTWETAYSSLKTALADWGAQGAHIWVKAGTYTTVDENAPVFVIPFGTQVYGGFAQNLTGTNGSVEDRAMDPAETAAAIIAPGNASILENTCANCSDRPVVVIGSNARLDGFTVRGGKESGGIRISNANGVTLAHLVVRDNTTTVTTTSADPNYRALGGGIAIDSSTNVRIEDAFIYKNSVHGPDGANTGAGGGGVAITTASEVVMQRCHIKANESVGGAVDQFLPTGGNGSGGGVFAHNSALELVDSLLDLNVARGGEGRPNTDGTYNNGGTGSGGGLFFMGDETHAVKLDSTRFIDNQAIGGHGANVTASNARGGDGGSGMGGGAYLAPSTLAPILTNLTFDGNVSQGGDGGNATPSGTRSAGRGGSVSGSGLMVSGFIGGLADFNITDSTFANNKGKVGVGGVPGAQCTSSDKYGNRNVAAGAFEVLGPDNCTGECPKVTFSNNTVTDNVAEVNCNPLDPACAATATGGGIMFSSTVTFVDGGNTYSGNKPSDIVWP